MAIRAQRPQKGSGRRCISSKCHWKRDILFQLFGGRILRFSDLERAIPAVSQKMLAQQVRRLEKDGLVRRVVYAEVPPKVECRLTD